MLVSEKVSLEYDLPLQVFILLEFAQKRKNEQCVYGAFVLHVVINLALLSSFHKLSRCSKTKTFHSFHRIGFFFYLSFLIVIICTCRVACIRLCEFLRFLCFKASSNYPQNLFDVLSFRCSLQKIFVVFKNCCCFLHHLFQWRKNCSSFEFLIVDECGFVNGFKNTSSSFFSFATTYIYQYLFYL